MANKLTKIAKEMLLIEEDLPFRFDQENNFNGEKTYIDDFDIYVFPQTWGSTSLGFGGIGGQMMTEANTCVLISMGPDPNCYVYFAGRFAYKVPYSREFLDDVAKCRVAPVNQKYKYFKKEKNNENH